MCRESRAKNCICHNNTTQNLKILKRIYLGMWGPATPTGPDMPQVRNFADTKPMTTQLQKYRWHLQERATGKRTGTPIRAEHPGSPLPWRQQDP
jgi:hypothetical protein